MSTTMKFGTYDIPERNRMAEMTIARYAVLHAAADAGIGLLGFIPIPGAAVFAIGGSLAMQIPMYKCLAADVGKIYGAPSMDAKVRGIVGEGLASGSIAELGGTFAVAVVSEFGADFFKEILGELVIEIGIGSGISFVPILGGIVSMGLDVVVAITMTWRVGTMVSMYYQNGARWVGGSRSKSYELAKKMTGGLSVVNEGRVDLDEVARQTDSVSELQAEELARFVLDLLNVAPDLTDNKIRKILRERNVPDLVAEKAIRKARR